MKYDQMRATLDRLRSTNNLRTLPEFDHQGRFAVQDGRKMLNLSTNDYLGLATDVELRREFMESLDPATTYWSSSSSRLLTGNFNVYRKLEARLARLYGREAALVFNCGYHANTGILPAISDKHTLILADKLVHASLIDGIRLSGADSVRYRHNDYDQLESLLEARHAQYDTVICVTESIFSMDGDKADLRRLCDLKKRYPALILYVDEAHGFGVCGKRGLGCAEEQDCIQHIDILVGTLGKAAASEGAFVICDQVLREFLINTMRPFIFTTAVPPVNVEWTSFIIDRMASFEPRREHLRRISAILKQALSDLGLPSVSESAIIPFMVGDSGKAAALAAQLQKLGFFALPVRPPTVPEGTSRIRFSLSAAFSEQEIQSLAETLKSLS